MLCLVWLCWWGWFTVSWDLLAFPLDFCIKGVSSFWFRLNTWMLLSSCVQSITNLSNSLGCSRLERSSLMISRSRPQWKCMIFESSLRSNSACSTRVSVRYLLKVYPPWCNFISLASALALGLGSPKVSYSFWVNSPMLRFSAKGGLPLFPLM